MADVNWNRYPEVHAEELCAAIARHEQWPASGVVATSGSNVLISLLVQLVGQSRTVLTVKPNFALYALAAQLLGSEVLEVPLLESFVMDVDRFADAMKRTASKGGLIYLARPHAPTGTLLRNDHLQYILNCSDNWIVVIDEAYHHFSGVDAKRFASANDNVVILRTLSKAWGLAGLRLGYALCSNVIAANLRKLSAPFGISTLQSIVAQAALSNSQYMYDRVRIVVEQRDRVYSALQAHPTWKTFPSHGNFLLIRTPDAAAAHARLLALGLLVRRQDSYYGLSGCIRVTIGAARENDDFLTAARS